MIHPETVTQFVAHALDIASFPPPKPKRGAQFGAGDKCWLCGGDTGGVGWPQATAIAPTFTNHNQSRANWSDAVCQPCAALTRAESWQAVVARRELSLKTWTQAGWHSYSHFVCEDGVYECPTPSRIRAILIDPPAGRWVLGINPSGKKHTLFKAAICDGASGSLTVQFDETRLYFSTTDFHRCLAAFEALAGIGCAKDDILSGRYSPVSVMRAGAAWRPAEMTIRPWRESRDDLMELVHFCALSATAQGFDFGAKVGAPRSQAIAPAGIEAQGGLW